MARLRQVLLPGKALLRRIFDMPCPYWEKTTLPLLPRVAHAKPLATWGTGVIFTSRLSADACATEKQKPRRVSTGAFCLRRDLRCESNLGAVEWIRTTTVLLPPAPQAGASASSATTARVNVAHLFRGEALVRDTDYRRVSLRRQYQRCVNIRAWFSGNAFT
jgi:hypothetical protein